MNSVSILQEVDLKIATLLAQYMPLQKVAESLDALDFVHCNEQGVMKFNMRAFRQHIKDSDMSGLSSQYDYEMCAKSFIKPVVKISSGSTPIERFPRKKKVPVIKIKPVYIPKVRLKKEPKPEVIQSCITCHYQWPLKYTTICPACTYRVVTDTNNLTATHPDLVIEYSSRNEKAANEVCVSTRVKYFGGNVKYVSTSGRCREIFG